MIKRKKRVNKLMLYSYESSPYEVKLQITLIMDLCKKYIINDLIGVYLHGSLAMECFNPNRSDLDIIVVSKVRISPDIKIKIIKELMNISLKPSQVEISFLVEDKLSAGNFPMHYDLHYSEFWRKAYKKKIANPEDEIWREDVLKDIDLGAHIRIINERGITLFGREKHLVFPKVNDDDYLKAILCDFEDAFEGYTEKPEYYILNGCRVLSFLENGAVMSKKEAGEWGIEKLPDKFKTIINIALNLYIGRIPSAKFNNNNVKKFLNYISNKVQLHKL